MLEEILAHINNYFVASKQKGGYEISNGTISLPFLQTNQYFRIVGSVFNDGVYKYPASGLTDEEFAGEVWALAVPDTVIALSADIDAWNTTNQPSAYVSESFGGYSYQKLTNGSGKAVDWTDVFKARLSRWRRL
jgi:hypothetical protein